MNHEFDQALLTDFYSNLYRGNAKHDSPEQSRIEMIRNLAAECAYRNNIRILNIGAGRQSLEKQFFSAYRSAPWVRNISFISFDIAAI